MAGLADGEHHRDPLCEQAPCHERERLRGRTIEPLHIVDQAHQRLCLGRPGQEAQHCQGDEEVIRGGPFPQPEGNPQRILLRTGQVVEPAEHGRAQLMQTRERELHLRLDARRSHDAPPRRVPQQVLQQRGLADTGFASQDQHSALDPTGRGQAVGPALRTRCAGHATACRDRPRASIAEARGAPPVTATDATSEDARREHPRWLS